MKYIHFDTINSTNTYLKENYLSLEHLTVVSASHQTQGRGRNGRFWYDEDDAMFSILLKENISNPTDYTFIAALTVLKVLNFYNLKPLIKWPNDLYVNDKKIAGILLEGVIKDNKQACVIIGIGVNTNSISFNNEYRVPPTSIKLETDQEVNNIDFIKKCGEEFINLLKKYEKDSSYWVKPINDNFYLKDKKISFKSKDKNLVGNAVGVDEDGKLIVYHINDTYLLSSDEVYVIESKIANKC